MNREDLGEMLEKQVGSWARHGDVNGRGSEDMDDIFRWAAEGFWNDVIDVLIGNAHLDENMRGIDRSDTVQWLEDQKIGDDDE